MESFCHSPGTITTTDQRPWQRQELAQEELDLEAAEPGLGWVLCLTVCVTFLALSFLAGEMGTIFLSPGLPKEANETMVVKSCLCTGEVIGS